MKKKRESITMATIASSCEDCGSVTAVKLEPYGSSFLAAISCPSCGDSYDTNLDPADIEALR